MRNLNTSEIYECIRINVRVQYYVFISKYSIYSLDTRQFHGLVLNGLTVTKQKCYEITLKLQLKISLQWYSSRYNDVK